MQSLTNIQSKYSQHVSEQSGCSGCGKCVRSASQAIVATTLSAWQIPAVERRSEPVLADFSSQRDDAHALTMSND